VNPHRYAKGDVCVHTTKPGPGRVAGKRIRTVNPLEAAHERGKLSARQLEASRKVEALVARCSIAGGHSRDSTRMGEPRGGEQSDESAERQAAARATLRSLCTMMDHATWLALRDISLGDRGVRQWRDTSLDVRRFRMGCDIAADFWRIPTYSVHNSDKS
jgi:hypothetical protein